MAARIVAGGECLDVDAGPLACSAGGPAAVASRNRTSTRATFPALLLYLMLTALALPSTSAGSEDNEQAKPARLFASDATLAVTLKAPWRELSRNKKSAIAYPATLEYSDASATRQTMALTVEPRGITRLKVCAFPPIKLGFDKGTAVGTPFRGNKSLKLVTHCANGKRWEQYPLREFLAYRIYNLITPHSFRVRPLSVTYFDSERNVADGPHFAFLIEDDSKVAKRNSLEKLEIPTAKVSQFEPLESNRFALFQFLIGNTDWEVVKGPAADRCCHNSKLIGPSTHVGIVAVPYDLDSSGLVDAHYAAPHEALPIESNRERLFRGFCAHLATLPAVRREFLQHEARILALVNEHGALSAGSREDAAAYLTKGFDILRDNDRFARSVTAKCRK